jgi:hypothetical protein
MEQKEVGVSLANLNLCLQWLAQCLTLVSKGYRDE